jgi:hypothetical protein
VYSPSPLIVCCRIPTPRRSRGRPDLTGRPVEFFSSHFIFRRPRRPAALSSSIYPTLLTKLIVKNFIPAT